MANFTNTPFAKRLRAAKSHDTEDSSPKRSRSRTNPVFGVHAPSTPSLDSFPGASESGVADATVAAKDYGDRFVPSRDSGDLRASFHLLEGKSPSAPTKKLIPTESDALKEQANSIFASLLHTEVAPSSPVRASSPVRQPSTVAPPSTPTRRRLFNFNTPSKSNPATPDRRLDTPNDEAYSMSPVRQESRQLLESPRRKLRSVCKTPYRVLDAPELADDFYLNLVDWSSTNVLSVGLGSCVYLWTAHTAAVSKLCDLADAGDTVSSVSWVQKGSTLAIGTLSGRMYIYDASTLQRIRMYPLAHTNRIGALSWNTHVLTSGSRDRMIYHRDVREADQKAFLKSSAHRQEVCGLRWNAESGVQSAALASGGNDNKVCIWDLRGSKRAKRAGSGGGTTSGDEGNDVPLWKFHEHTAAVKALAWDPHISGVLASGGGTADKHIRFWNTQNGTLLNQLDTGSQVCNLTWSLTSHELVSTHGFSSTTAQNQICIWKYPSLDMVAALTGHSHRVLYLAMSPDGETIVTGAGDETLRFWNAFPKQDRRERKESRLDYGRLIR
ncbi:WD40 repeat-like protein [Irpex rosettiformis]|uniref:WD40 repeat-like protein n=1 Tax=Irpex rosettiformis TaxID=378272 RepID=A0ACB8U9Z4_9APHY|nr:WD40 repeat-like protein [Irpex rosettiformis]